MISWAGQWTQTPSANPLQQKKMKCSFLYYIQLLMLARLVNGLKPHPPPLCSQKNEMLLLWITLNFWWLPGLSDGLKPYPPPLSSQKKMKCLFLDYVHFWWSAWLIDELEPHLPPLSYQKNEMLNFWLRSTSDDQPSWSMDSKSICQPSPANKMKCFFLDYVHFWWSARLVDGLEPHLPPFSSQKNEMLTFGLCSLRMNSQAGRWTQTPSATPLQPIKWNTHFWITFNFWWSAGLVGGLKPHSPPLSSQKMKCSFFDYVQLLMISWAGQWT